MLERKAGEGHTVGGGRGMEEVKGSVLHLKGSQVIQVDTGIACIENRAKKSWALITKL